MAETYRRLKSLINQETEGRYNFIEQETKKLGLKTEGYDLASPRGKDRHLVTRLNQGRADELWLTANYDTFGRLPAANNNASSVVTLLGLSEILRDTRLPVNIRIIYFDGGLDADLITKRKRDLDFIPGSKPFVQHMLDEEIDFIETYTGAIVVQAVGKGHLCVFEKSGKKTPNSKNLNQYLLAQGDRMGVSIEVRDHSPQADNVSFLDEDLEATVLSRYHEGSWHRMQTKSDDLSNVDVATIEETTKFLCGMIRSYQTK